MATLQAHGVAKALDRYVGGPGAFAGEALAAATVREVVERLIHGAVELTAGPRTPPGCLNVSTVHACGPDAAPVRELALARRMAGEAALRRRLERAPDLPSGHDPATLARLVHTISDGIAVQAAAGRTRQELREVADLALRTLFPD
ncbi:hypothetical protein [Nonomuraea sp. bgisy101]|uniref:hypothetical protein n=1 Tax=Nonomuraea sp. bgisy101 TaxID=3413784 RepID=UPI003D74DB4C